MRIIHRQRTPRHATCESCQKQRAEQTVRISRRRFHVCGACAAVAAVSR